MPAHDQELKRRASDDPALARKLAREIRYQRRRTIVMSVVAAGLVSLFIGRAIEVQSSNDQVDRNRINCNFTQDDRKDRIDTLLETAGANGRQSDSTLGNKKPLIYKEGKPYGKLVVAKKPIPPADFSKPPYDAFKSFKVLIIAQAKDQRATQVRNIRRAKLVKNRLENCNKVFPKKKTFFVF